MNREILACPINQWTGFTQAVKTDKWELSGNLLAWLPSLVLTAPIVGYLCVLLRLPFGWGAWAVIALVSAALTIPIRQFFKIDTWGELIGIVILLAGIIVGYGSASIAFEPGSPATAVWYKSLNLIDGGHLYRSMSWLDSFIGAGVTPASAYEQFGALVPDAQYTFGDLHFMGSPAHLALPGGSWFFAWWGMIARSLLFIGPLILMLGTGIILNRLLYRTMEGSHWAVRLLLALALMAMPVYLYFGREMVPALYALPCYGIALLLLMKAEWGCGPYPALLIAALTLPILCGIDFILPFFITVLLLTWHKPAWGLSLGVSGVLAFYGLQAAEPLWFGQVVGMPIWVRGIVYFTLVFYLIGLVLRRVLSREKAEKWSRSRPVTIVFYAGILAGVFFLVRNNGFTALTLAFSGVVLLAGLITLPAVLKERRWPLLFRLMVAGLFISQLIFFRERPITDLYADYQPYIGLLLPLIWLSFGLWIQKAHGWPRYLVLGSLVVLTAAQAAGSGLVPGERTAKSDSITFARQWEALDADTVAYDPGRDQALAPLLWYGGMTPAPMMRGGEIQVLDAVTDDWLYITGEPVEAYRATGVLDYTSLPPGQGSLPDPVPRQIRWTLASRDDILQEIHETGTLYPSLTWREETGAAYARYTGLSVPVGDNQYLVVESSEAGLLDRGLTVCADGVPLAVENPAGQAYWFRLPRGMEKFSVIDMYIDTPEGGTQGGEKSGISITRIALSPSPQR